MPPEASLQSFPVGNRIGAEASSVHVFDRHDEVRGLARMLRGRSGPPRRNPIRGPVEIAFHAY